MSLSKRIDELEKRIVKLEKVSHEQPDMKVMIQHAVNLVKKVDKEIKETKRIERPSRIPRLKIRSESRNTSSTLKC